jgi:hypothetical protein
MNHPSRQYRNVCLSTFHLSPPHSQSSRCFPVHSVCSAQIPSSSLPAATCPTPLLFIIPSLLLFPSFTTPHILSPTQLSLPTPPSLSLTTISSLTPSAPPNNVSSLKHPILQYSPAAAIHLSQSSQLHPDS